MMGSTTEPGFFIGGPQDLRTDEEKAAARLACVRPCPMSFIIIFSCSTVPAFLPPWLAAAFPVDHTLHHAQLMFV